MNGSSDFENAKKKPLTQNLLTTEGLNNARSSISTPPSFDKIQVNVEVRFRGGAKRDQTSTDPTFGKWGQLWKRDVFLSEILDNSLVTSNVTWDKDNAQSLERNEVEFRWYGNKVFQPGTQNLTVGEVYNKYLTGDKASFYMPPEKVVRASKGPTMFLELCINKLAYNCRTAVNADSEVSLGPKSGARKRRHNQDRGESDQDWDDSDEPVRPLTSKRPRQFSTAISVEDTGEVEVMWADSTDITTTVEPALLHLTALATRATKTVHKLVIDGLLYVAKAFFDTGNGSVSIEDNATALEQEAVRLQQAQWFWKKFVTSAKEQRDPICQDIRVSDGFLICIVRNTLDELESVLPSHPSDTNKIGAASTVLLIEPHRTRSVVKFSGTLQHPHQTDKMGKTITAFAHFVHHTSSGEFIFVDIQGSPATINGRDGITLFDLMSHSVQGDSGVGDHGVDGIKSFVDQHWCDFLCTSLGLSLLATATESNE
ncbi:hypothetical protein DXG01_016948 [Tephrocybe rancida]|nr:hypothetical protein DXG01_016948 [Tephrocybe rancida]